MKPQGSTLLNHSEFQFLRESVSRWRWNMVLVVSAFVIFFAVVSIAFIVNLQSLGRVGREAAINKAKELESRAEFLTKGNASDAFLGFHVAVEAEARLLDLGLHGTAANSIIARDLEKYPEYQTIHTPKGEVLMGFSHDEAFAYYIDFEGKSLKVRKGLTEELLATAPLPPMLAEAISELGSAAFVEGLPHFKTTRDGSYVFISCPANLHYACNFTQSGGMLYRLKKVNPETYQLSPVLHDVQLVSFDETESRIAYCKSGKLDVRNTERDQAVLTWKMASPVVAMEFTHDGRYLSAMTMDTLFIMDLAGKRLAYQHAYQTLYQGAQTLGYIGNGVFGTNLGLAEQARSEEPSPMGVFSPGPYGDDYSGMLPSMSAPTISMTNLRSLPWMIDLNDKGSPYQKNPRFAKFEFPATALSSFGLPMSIPLADSTCHLLSSSNQSRSFFFDGTTMRIMDPVFEDEAKTVVPDCKFLNWGISPKTNFLYLRSPECAAGTLLYPVSNSNTDYNRKFRTISKDIFLNDNPRHLTTSTNDEVVFWNWKGELQLAIKKVKKYPLEDLGTVHYNHDSSLVCLATRFRIFFADLSKGVVMYEQPLYGASFLGWTGKQSYCLYKDISPDLTDDPTTGFRIGKSMWTDRFTLEVRDAVKKQSLWKRTIEKHLNRYQISEEMIRGNNLFFFEKDIVSGDYLDSKGCFAMGAIDLSTGNIRFTIPFAEGRILSQMDIDDNGTSAILQFANQDGNTSAERWDLESQKLVGDVSNERQFSRTYHDINLKVTLTGNAIFGISLATGDTLWRQARMNGRYWPDKAGTHFGLSTADTLYVFTMGTLKKLGEVTRSQMNLREVTFQTKYDMVAYTDSGKYLVVANFKTNQEMIRLPLAVMMGDLNFPNDLRFSDDGERIEVWIKGSDSISNYLLVKSWYWRPQKLMQLACKRLPRDFTAGQVLDLFGKAERGYCPCHAEN